MVPVQRPRPHYYVVLSCLLLLLSLIAVAPVVAAVGTALNLLGLAVPVLAVAAASDTRWHRRTVIGLAALCAVFNAEGIVQIAGLPKQVGMVVALVFLAYTTYLLLRGVLRSQQVTGDVIAGALASYLMIGLTWAMAYGLAETIAPGSIAASAAVPADLPTLIYFSYITLMTVGYGDVTPASSVTQMLAVFEGFVGITFTTIILAVLVAILLGRRQPGSR